jgi:hypothetical protein
LTLKLKKKSKQFEHMLVILNVRQKVKKKDNKLGLSCAKLSSTGLSKQFLQNLFSKAKLGFPS